MDADRRWSGYPGPLRSFLGWLRSLSVEGRDAFMYGASAVFAGVTAVAMGIPLYRQWGQMAVGPYAAATVLMAVVAWRLAVRDRAGTGGPAMSRRWRLVARLAAFAIVLFGATVVPLAIEVVWASEGNAALHVQPEVLVVERAGIRAAHGRDPYQVVDRNGRILIRQSAIPVYELYYPYLPGMVVFGFSSGSKVEARLTDARIQFLLFTVVVTCVALSRVRPRSDAVGRSLQALTVLPTAALPLATGGDDMPVVALMLLGLVALQRRRPVLAGLALGAASTLKFTAWPVVILAALAATDLDRRRAMGRYVLAVLAVVVPVVVPVALHNPSAFVDNVVRFPLGLAGVASPAASALPGHILVSAFPRIHRAYVVVVGVVGLAVLGRYLYRKPPRTAAAVAALTGWVMLVAVLVAPATRVGYLLYPINLFLWAWMFRGAADPADGVLPVAGDGSDEAQLPSGVSYTSTEYGVVPADVVGETTTPVSQ
ncbi:MAG: glycosyltransferase family 87 protein [Acidimicrobiales bacterium]